MNPMLTIAVRAARAAGDVLIHKLDHINTLKVQEKSRNDFVSEIDLHAESVIIETIRNTYPRHAFIAEESGKQGNSDYEWIIDPLDGTTNYLHGFPQFAVSIALRHKHKLAVGVIYDPLRQELFTASAGEGAQLNNRRIRVSQHRSLEGALLGTGFPFKDQALLNQYLDTFKAFFPMTAGIRRAGSAALDLAYLACGRLDGFWEYQLEIWDIAAGVLLITEAGGIVGDIQGNDDYLESGNIIAANPKLLKAMLNKIKPPP